jgi:hypothetical protein
MRGQRSFPEPSERKKGGQIIVRRPKNQILEENAPQTRRSSSEPRGMGLGGAGGTASSERCGEGCP